MRRPLTILRYTGRRSGRAFSSPAGYRRSGDVVTIGAKLPRAKVWWRNFLDDGAPASVEPDGVVRAGHAMAHRDDAGQVTVTVRLAPAGAPRAAAEVSADAAE